jgi:hypothetical protein
MQLKELPASVQTKAKKGLCIEKFCTKSRPKRGKGFAGLRCHCCSRKKWAEDNPGKYIFANLRGNARRRGKEFTLTWPQFEEFLKRENYLRRKRGRTKTSVSIDRQKNSEGYHESNLATLTIQGNSWKRNYVDYFARQYES